jgi:hypothetical protein
MVGCPAQPTWFAAAREEAQLLQAEILRLQVLWALHGIAAQQRWLLARLSFTWLSTLPMCSIPPLSTLQVQTDQLERLTYSKQPVEVADTSSQLLGGSSSSGDSSASKPAPFLFVGVLSGVAGGPGIGAVAPPASVCWGAAAG